MIDKREQELMAAIDEANREYAEVIRKRNEIDRKRVEAWRKVDKAHGVLEAYRASNREGGK